jgi:hypothetical protein
LKAETSGRWHGYFGKQPRNQSDGQTSVEFEVFTESVTGWKVSEGGSLTSSKTFLMASSFEG